MTSPASPSSAADPSSRPPRTAAARDFAADADGALDRVIAAMGGGGEARPGQREMVQAIVGGLVENRHVVVRAGTGTGKSIAYLVPSILDGRRVVVATASKALQDQLAEKDLPFLRDHIGKDFSWAVVKGRANYLCRQRLAEVEAGFGQAELEVGDNITKELERLAAWAERTITGDRAELAEEPSPRAWAALSVSGDECPGAGKCPEGGACFAEAAKAKAAEADIVVANLALYGVHLGSGERVLPEHDVVVIDEAHQLEDVLSSTLGFELGAGRLAGLAVRVRAIVADRDLPIKLVEAGATLAAVLRPYAGQRLTRPLPDEVVDALVLVRQRVERAQEALRAIKTDVADADQRRARAQRVVQAVIEELDVVAELPENYVAWVQGEGAEPRLAVAPVEVGPVLGATVWGQRTAVLTSATIPPGFSWRIGLPKQSHDVVDVGSPFDYETNGLLYCATHLPDPRTPAYRDGVHTELEALIRAAGGRTLALFTSWKALQAAAEVLRPKLPFKVLVQGELPVPRLVAAFRDEESSCLFATTGLFQGIDVPGATLSLVTIDRLPFPRPDEPLLEARRERAGSAAFMVIDVPRAATLLAQAAGRLIRTSTDRGVVAVFDPRLASARYRWDIIKALPPFHRTKHRSEVEAFLQSLRG